MSFQNLLKGVYLFKDLNDKDLEALSKQSSLVSYGPGDEIFSQGDEAKAMYLIKMGSVKIQQKGRTGEEINVATLGTGSLFGEMAFVDGEKRSATVSAVEKCDIITLPFEKLKELLRGNEKMSANFYMSMAKFLCNRLRVTTTDLSFAKEKNIRHF